MLLGGLARLLTGSGDSALQVLSVAATLAAPPLAALIVHRVTGDAWAARSAFLVTLAQPLLPLLGLSQLSDSTGVAFFLLFLWLTSTERFWLAGFALGFALCCRPSYLILFVSAWLILSVINRRAALKAALGGGLVVVPMFGTLLALEGWAYLEEAQRFMQGHLLVWGNSAITTEHARSTWLDLLMAQPGLGLFSALCLIALWVAFVQWQSPVVGMAGAALLAGMVWTGLVQNPESLRHLAPLFVLTGILVSCARPSTFRYSVGLLTVTISVWLTATAVVLERRPPPLMEVVNHLAEQPPGIVVTNHGVEVMREWLARHRIFDAFYRSYARHAQNMAEVPVYRVSSTTLTSHNARVFPGRVFGEPSYWIVRLK